MAPKRERREQGERVRVAGLACLAFAAFALLPSSARATTETFSYTGAPQNWVVPAGVTSAAFDLYGAQGGGGAYGTVVGGDGGRATATIAVTPGAVIQINIGGKGGDFSVETPGFNGGGIGFSGGGGGASDIRIGGSALAERVLVAGGGGGGGCTPGDPHGGPGGGLQGGDGVGSCINPGFAPGGGGTQSTGGVATPPATAGAFGAGGAAPAGGGGGGGWYGGGGGANNGGGGGGSGYGPSGTSFETGVRGGDGLGTVTYSVNPTVAPPSGAEDTKCEQLRKKLNRQKRRLKRAGSEAKRSLIKNNITDTRSRLRNLGC